jgi:hypothetical protein
MDSSIGELYNLVYYTKWGVQHNIQTQGPKKDGEKTATEIMVDEQPKIEALYAYSDSAEDTEKMIADYMGYHYFPNTYKGADINYGRRLMLETPDKIMEVLVELIIKESPYEVVREKMEAYYHTLYQGDSVKLNIMLKLIDVEPLPFYSMSKAKNLLSPLEYAKKTYYNDWRGLKSTQDMLIRETVENLRKSLHDYTIDRVKEIATLPELLQPVVEKPKAEAV